MHHDTAYNLFQRLEHDEQFFTYQGDFSDQVTSMIINLIEESLHHSDQVPNIRLKNKVSFLMVESFQNIIRHADPTPEDSLRHAESFQVRSHDNTHYITSANLIEKDKTLQLKEKLDQLNVLDKAELKRLYMTALDNNTLSEKGGAGLGLIEMARKSGRKLLYEFIPKGENQLYFYLQTSLDEKKNELSTPESSSSLLEAISIHQFLKEHGIFVLNKGNFSHDAIKPMLNMVEKNLVSHVRLMKEQKILFHMLVEMLQNISNHSYETTHGKNEGIFYMGQNQAGYFITAGNYVAKEKIATLRSNIDDVNQMTKEELQTLYKKKLRSGQKQDAKGAGIGLIDLARFSKTRLEYRLFDVDVDKSFFSITVYD